MRTLLYLQPSGTQYRYHRLVWDGVNSQEAAQRLTVLADTGRKWQRRLREKAAGALAVPVDEVNYVRALRCLFEPVPTEESKDNQ